MIILTILIVLGTIFQSVIMLKSGMMHDFGIGYWGPLARDGVWHEALVAQLSKNIPPFNPGLSGEILTNYHYFYDLLVSLIHQLGIPSNFLIYKFFPIFFSILLGIGTYKLANVLFKDKRTSLLAVFFAYFGSSFGWMVDLIKGKEIGGESAFWANQPVSMNLNPPFAISLIIIIFTLLLINKYLIKPNKLIAMLIILMSGTLIGFKVYAGVVLLGGLFILALKRIIFDKDYKFVIIPIVSFLISLVIILPQSKSSLGLIEFNPFWLINTMIDAGDRVGIPNFTARRFAYLGGEKWLHLIALQIICFLIFFIGNIGTRAIGLLAINKKQLKSDLFILVFAMMGVSFLPPLLFTQKGNAWNIIQFFYYFLFFAGLFGAYAVKKLPLTIAILIILITPISSVATFRSWLYPNPPAYLSRQEYDALSFLFKSEDGVVLKHPFNQGLRGKFKDPYPLAVYADNSYVSAFSGKSVFIEDVEQQIVLNTDYKNRLKDAERFFIEKDLTWSNRFLKESNIRYIYLPKIYQLPMAEKEYNMEKIFENDEVNIYKVLK